MITSKEILLIADTVSQEKNIDRTQVLFALGEGLATALKRDYPEGSNIRVFFDEDGTAFAYRLFKLVDSIENVEAEMLFSEVEDEIVNDGFVWENLNFDFNNLNRQQFTITRQVAMNKIKNESKLNNINDLLNKDNLLQSGITKIVKKDHILLDCNGIDISIPRKNLLFKDSFKPGDKVYFVLEQDSHGNFIGTRTSDEFLIQILKKEIYVIDDDEVQIVGIARNPGFKSKVILKNKRGNGNPVKIALGNKGINIQNVNRFLNGEYVDLIAYDEDEVQLLISLLSPVDIVKIVIDEESKTMNFAVPNDMINYAIGKNGKNIDMISKLIGWNLNVFSEEDWNKKQSLEENKTTLLFQHGLNCDAETATYLIENGFSSLEEVAYVPVEELLELGFDEDSVALLRKSAANVLSNPLTSKLVNGFVDLKFLGFDDDEITKLASNKVYSLTDVADLSTFDLIDIIPTIDNERATDIIVKSRQ